MCLLINTFCLQKFFWYSSTLVLLLVVHFPDQASFVTHSLRFHKYLICYLQYSHRYFGQIDVSVASAAFVVAMALLLQRGNPRFAQLSSTMFGLFYCGYLPCFWVKLRCGLAVPALNTSKSCVVIVPFTELDICAARLFQELVRSDRCQYLCLEMLVIWKIESFRQIVV